MAVKPLDADLLCAQCDPDQFDFTSTEQLEDLPEFFGQTRALEAIDFGTSIQHRGYNMFVLGPAGTGRHSLVRQFLNNRSADQKNPSDWVYVNNFSHPHKPDAIPMPAGRASGLSSDMDRLVDELRSAIPAVFDSEDYRIRLQEIDQELKDRQEHAFSELQEQATKHNISMLRTPTGFAFAPVRNGEVITPEEYDKLPDNEKARIEEIVDNLQEALQTVVNQIPLWVKETREKVKALNREMTRFAVGHLIDEIKTGYRDLPEVIGYLDAVENDVIENAEDFLEREERTLSLLDLTGQPSFRRYKVNVLVDNSQNNGAPVVYEDNPTFQNLVGRAEHASHMGTLVTDFTLIKAGALHRANGGYLILDADKLLSSPYAWNGLKRALFSNEIKIESLGELLSVISTVSLEPESIPLDVKVVLIGERLLYYLMVEYDPDVPELFKVEADLDDSIDRSKENVSTYARLIATHVRERNMLHFDHTAVARVIEESARLEEDSRKLTTHLLSITDLLCESDFIARKNGHQLVTAADVQQAIDAQLRRSDRVLTRLQENMLRGITLIETQGATVGQVNGLTVIELGNVMFGQPSRITATARMGEDELTDIESEVELGGSIHSKGVLIISSFLKSRYSRHAPLSLSASVTFEQSYGKVEGDSASVGELCALLSAIAGVPIQQSLAVTGSVNQLGQVQAIGGVNEKIEGFFDLCKLRGMKGEQGVIIPASNVQHLMLKQEVVAAARAGRFSIYAVETVDEAAALLTGLVAGEPDAEGNYPAGTLNERVETRLMQFAEMRREFSDDRGRHDSEHDAGSKDGDE